MENNLIVVNKNEIVQFVEEGGKLVLKANAEDHLKRLFDLEEMIKKAIEDVKDKIIETGLSIDPDFKGIIGKKVKAFYRYTDSPYDYIKEAPTSLIEPFLKETKYFRVDSEKVDAYFNSEGKLPDGIIEKPNRNKKLIINFKDNGEE